MNSNTEQEEREHLEVIKQQLISAIQAVEDRVKQYSKELRQKKEYIYEHQSGMDEADMVAAGQSINRMADTGESAVARKKKLLKLAGSPYFGRIDFVQTDNRACTQVYIGMSTFADEAQRINRIYDWRAPISSMFYDFELGAASYQTPSRIIYGEVALKRQYKIREGKMEFMFENAVNIQDDLLQKELSKASDDKMKTIVATIQRDQNAAIRNETANVMIIQGVAGSGKTSIALHRIAFLLYRFRETLTAKDILIISPNKVFADYIANVLPELGEEQIPEIGMEELASDLLGGRYAFQNFFEQVSALQEDPDPAFIERIRFKSSFEFLAQLNRYFIHIENNYFTFTELKVAGVVVPFPFILERFRAYSRLPLLSRFPEVAREVQHHVRQIVQRKLTGNEKAQIAQSIPRMFRVDNLFDLYKDFYQWIGRPEMFRLISGERLEYADVFPLIYCKIRMEGVQRYDHVRHLLVDEMQDYTPVQYAVISRLFKCRKTILGDVSQQVNPYSASSAERIEQVFPQADRILLHRSYRSTFEITTFAQRINPNPDLVAMERHGEQPAVLGCADNGEEIERVKDRISHFKNSGHHTLGILCKTSNQATFLWDALKPLAVHLLTVDSTSFKQGIVVTTVHLSKGLEFDEVVIPFVSSRNYHTEVDKSLLYIACTRAMHTLTLTYSKERSTLLQP